MWHRHCFYRHLKLIGIVYCMHQVYQAIDKDLQGMSSF